MNLGKRIEKRLADLNWERKRLLEALPDLTPQALSNLIVRDSKRSEWDVQIANALGVSVMWLVYGEDQPYTIDGQCTRIDVQEKPAAVLAFRRPDVDAITEIANHLDDDQLEKLRDFAQWLADKQRPDQNSIPRAGQ